MSRDEWVKTLAPNGEWGKSSAPEVLLNAVSQLVVSYAMPESEARMLVEDIVAAIRGEYGD